MSRESVAWVTRTFTCDRRFLSSSWLEIGSLVMSFRICPCRNRLCAINPIGSSGIYSQLHNYAFVSGCLSIYFFMFFHFLSKRFFPPQLLAVIQNLTPGGARRKIPPPGEHGAQQKKLLETYARGRYSRRAVLFGL